MSDYEERKNARIEYYKQKSMKFKEQAGSTLDDAKEMASVIPFGQPILIGHHSENRDRNYRERISKSFEKARELQNKAEHYSEKAAAAENNSAISSDDPQAIQKLTVKLDALKERQFYMKKANRILQRAGISDTDKVMQLEECLSPALFKEVMIPDYSGRIGFFPYQLTNNLAKIKRIEKRIKDLKSRSDLVTEEKELGGIRIVENVEANRIQVFFPDRLNSEGYRFVRTCGFVYSRRFGCFQRQLNNAGRYAVDRLLERFQGE